MSSRLSFCKWAREAKFFVIVFIVHYYVMLRTYCLQSLLEHNVLVRGFAVRWCRNLQKRCRENSTTSSGLYWKRVQPIGFSCVICRIIYWFQKWYSFRSMTKNNEVIAENPFQNSGVTRRFWRFQHATVLEWSIEVGFSLILSIYKDAWWCQNLHRLELTLVVNISFYFCSNTVYPVPS